MKNKLLVTLFVCIIGMMGVANATSGWDIDDINDIDFVQICDFDANSFSCVGEGEDCIVNEFAQSGQNIIKVTNLSELTWNYSIKYTGSCPYCLEKYPGLTAGITQYTYRTKNNEKVIYPENKEFDEKVKFVIEHNTLDTNGYLSEYPMSHDYGEKTLKECGYEYFNGFLVNFDELNEQVNEFERYKEYFFTTDGESLYLIEYASNQGGLYFEIDSPIYWKSDSSSGQFYNVFFMARRDEVDFSGTTDMQHVFLCSRCAKCNAEGCSNNGSSYIDLDGDKGYSAGVASNGFTVAGQYGIEESSLRVSKYCLEHTCGFFWETVNGGRAAEGIIQSIEGLTCDKPNGYANGGSLFCEYHTCSANCKNPIIGANMLDGSVETVNQGKRTIEVQPYTGNESQYYSKFCAKHMCWEYNCKEERQNPDRAGKTVDGDRSKDFCNYCITHGERCSIIGCDNFVSSEADVKKCDKHLNADLTNNYVECSNCYMRFLKDNCIEIVGQNNLCFICVEKLRDNPNISFELGNGLTIDASQLSENEVIKIKPNFTENAVDNNIELPNGEVSVPVQPSEDYIYIDWSKYEIIGKFPCGECDQTTTFVKNKLTGDECCANCLNDELSAQSFDPKKDTNYDVSGATSILEWECSKCGKSTHYALINNTKYCVSCGISEDGYTSLKEKEIPEDKSEYDNNLGKDEERDEDTSSNNNTSSQQPNNNVPQQCVHSNYPVPNTVVFGDVTEKTHKQVWVCAGCNSQQIVEYDHTYINGSCVCGALEDVELPTLTIIGFEETENVINVEPGQKIYLTLSDNKQLKSITYKWFTGINSGDMKSEPLEGKERTLYVGELTEEGNHILYVCEVIDATGNKIQDKTYTFKVGQKEDQGNEDITDTVKPTIEILGVDGFGRLEENTTTVITLERSRDIRFKVSDDKGLSLVKYNYYATGKNQNKDLQGKVESEEKIYIDPALDDNILSIEVMDLVGNKLENVTVKFKPAVENDDKERPKIKLITPINGVEAEENSVVKIMFTDNKGLDTVTWTKTKKLDATGDEELPQTGAVSFNGALAYPLEVANISSGASLKLGIELKDINGNVAKGEYTIRLNSKGIVEVKISGNADIYVEEDSELPIAWLVIPNSLEDTKEESEQGLTFSTDFMNDSSKKFEVKFTDNKMLKEVKYTIKYNGSEFFHKTESLEGLKEASVIGITETINNKLRAMNNGDFIELWASITDMNNNSYGSTPYVKFSKVGDKLVVSRYYMNDEYATDIELTYPTENISEDSLFVAKFADKNGIESVSYEVKPTKNGQALEEFGTAGISGVNRLEINEMAITQVSDYDGIEIILHATDSNGMVTTKNYKFEIKNGVVTEHRYCELCKLYDCTIQHNICPVCKNDGCQLTHTYCTICRTHDCGVTHIYCDTCNKYDCGITHEMITQ